MCAQSQNWLFYPHVYSYGLWEELGIDTIIHLCYRWKQKKTWLVYLELKSVIVQPLLLNWEIIQPIFIQIQSYVNHGFAWLTT